MTASIALQTRRLLICPSAAIAPEELHRYLIENRDAHSRWEPAGDESYFSLSNVRTRFIHGIDRPDERRFALLLHGGPEVIGLVNFTNIVGYPFNACHLGFSISVGQEGKGLMREGLLCLITRVFEVLDLNRVMANFLPRNFRSARLLCGLGFTIEGFAKHYLCIAGHWEDHILTSVLRCDWKPVSRSAWESQLT
jgi:[ribosomal protein S5]-alanine N-acetyltransferase